MLMTDSDGSTYSSFPPSEMENAIPLKCWGRTFEPLHLSEIWIPENLLPNRKSNIALNKGKPHIYHVLQMPSKCCDSFSVYVEDEDDPPTIRPELVDDDIFVSDSDESFKECSEIKDFTANDFKESCSSSSQGNLNSSEKSKLPLKIDFHLHQEKLHSLENLDLSHEAVHSPQNLHPSSDLKFSDKNQYKCENVSSHGNNLNSPSKYSCSSVFSDSSHEELPPINYKLENSKALCSDSSHEKLPSIENELVNSKKNCPGTLHEELPPVNNELINFENVSTQILESISKVSYSNNIDLQEISQLMIDEGNIAAQNTNYHIITESKTNVKKTSKTIRPKIPRTLPNGYLQQYDYHLLSEKLSEQQNKDAATSFRDRSFNDKNINYYPYEFPDLSCAQPLFRHSPQKLTKKSEETVSTRLSIQSVAHLLTDNSDPDGNELEFTEKNEKQMELLPDEDDVLIIENLPSTINEEALINILSGYGEVNSLSLLSCGKSLKAKLKIDCDLDWVIDTLNGSQVFGTGSDVLKCHRSQGDQGSCILMTNIDNTNLTTGH